MLSTLFTIPDATTTIAAAAEHSVPWFNELLPVVYVSVGVFLGVAFITIIINIFTGVFERFTRKDE